MAAAGSVSTAESILTMIREVLAALGMSFRNLLTEGSRTPAMTT